MKMVSSSSASRWVLLKWCNSFWVVAFMTFLGI